FSVGQCPTKPGGGGATPTMKTHDEACSTPVHNQTNPNETKPNQTKQNKTKRKRKTRQTENQRFEAVTGFFGVVFSFHGLAAPETLPHNAYDK
ncbi:MAG: hypothetical protein PHQ75_00720, partial [Thermoguttaceae bacterium]|nr:hypothetical protein [Thermoguttaceae bacterium]